MAGFETASLALAIPPLLVAAVEHYENCFRPFLRYDQFAKDAYRFRILFGVQKTIFRRECRSLLEEVVDQDTASRILDRAGHPLQPGKELDRQLDEVLGESKGSIKAITDMIKDKLSDIESESQLLGTAIEQERQVSSSIKTFTSFFSVC